MTEPQSETASGPLTGVTVLDLSAVVSGPMAAMVLADQGAKVIKVEPPGYGDGVRYMGANRGGVSAIFAMINRNKFSLAVDLKRTAGQEIIRRLVATSDVLLQNYRPGKMEQLGLDYASLRDLNPRLIYTSISGVGDTGPMSGQKVYDSVIQGLSGVLEAQAEPQATSDGGRTPKTVRTIIYDKVTALTAAQGISAALYQREKTGLGQHLKLSMLDAGIYFNWPDLMWNYSFEGEDVAYSGDLADMYEISPTSDGAIISHRLGADCRAYTTSEICEILTQNEIPVAPVNTRAAVLTDPQVAASGTLQKTEHPVAGTLLQPRSPLLFDAEAAEIPARSSPALGEHNREILADIGYSADEIAELFAESVIA